MARSPYPPECPAFRVVISPDALPIGTDFEATLIVFDGRVRVGATWPIVDEFGALYGRDEVRPLTRTARDMLALVSP